MEAREAKLLFYKQKLLSMIMGPLDVKTHYNTTSHTEL
uniref:Uncharacterized protein n=1 Tax=Physcomitrium patens TaxID=3218 RepID=A0A2K1K480_PHYPA|nr:hypothetical protein PHYPA_013045 [Physcomitrium patens]